MSILKKYWELIGGIVCAWLMNWFDKLELVSLQKIVNLMMIGLMLMGLVKYVFHHSIKSKIINKLLKLQKPVKAIEYANDPTSQGEELGELIEKSMKGVKNMSNDKNTLTWIWINKSQLVDIIYTFILAVFANFAIYSDLMNSILPEGMDLLWVKILVTVVSILLTILSWINTATSRKFDSVQSYLDVVKVKEEEKVNKILNSEQKAKYEHLLKEYQGKADEIRCNIKEITDKIDNIKLAIELGTTTEAEEALTLNSLNDEKNVALSNLSIEENRVKIVEDKINELK